MIRVFAPAKLNLTLDVVGRRADGYHLLESVFQSVTRYDTVTLKKIPEGVELNEPGGSVCPPEKNTAHRAARLFLERTGVTGGVCVTLEKTIPQQAGMGGGSADAAAVLLGMDALFATRLSRDALMEMGLAVGADVPFCLQCGTAMVTGIGEELRPLPGLTAGAFVVAQPPEGVSTAAAYGALDAAALTRRPDHEGVFRALETGDLTALGAGFVNVFEEALALPGVAAIRARMAEFSPLGSAMTGSGSAVFAFFRTPKEAEKCCAALAEEWPTAFVCYPAGGVVMEEIPDN